jgi:hypothetical protein
MRTGRAMVEAANGEVSLSIAFDVREDKSCVDGLLTVRPPGRGYDVCTNLVNPSLESTKTLSNEKYRARVDFIIV